MVQDWKKQLQSEDPKIRAVAIKQIALSGNQYNLPILREIAENDPDLRLREYAKKAARHLYASRDQDEPEKPSPAAPSTKDQAALEEDREVTPSDIPKPKVSRKDRETANAKVQRALTLHMYGQTKKGIKVLNQAFEKDPSLMENTYAKNVAAELTGQPFDLAIQALKDPSIAEVRDPVSEPQAGSSIDLDESRESQRNLVQNWLSFFGMSERFFLAEARKANGEDTLISVLVFTIAAVATFMINGFFQFQLIMDIMNEQLPAVGTDLPQIDFNIGMIFFVILIGTVIMTPLSFYLTVGMQYLGGRVFGGSGTFKVQAYLTALVQVPLAIISGLVSLLALIPVVNFVAGLVGFGISIYALILTVRLVKVTHGLGTGRAVAAIFVPPIILSTIGCCVFFTVGSSLLGSLTQLQ